MASNLPDNNLTHLIIFGYSLSLPWESLHLLYMTEASTFAGENVFGSFSKDMTDNKIVRTFCVGFQRSHGNSPLCGSSTGGWSIEMHRSPFYFKIGWICWKVISDDFSCLNRFHNKIFIKFVYLINIWMPHFCQKSNRRGRVWVVWREFHMGLKVNRKHN